MEKIFNLKEVSRICKQIKAAKKTIVLVGGCFDLLHLGHIKYLEAAKKQGDILMVGLENDVNVKRIKGHDRPVNNERLRAQNLITTGLVDYVVILPTLQTGDDYLKMVQMIKPDIIAITNGDPQLKNKQNQAKIVDGQVKVVIDNLSGFSTTEIIKSISEKK